MVSQKVTISNPTGLHARPAVVLAKVAAPFNSDIFIFVGDKKVQVKSVLSIMAAAIKTGTEVEVQCSGDDEEQALKAILEAIEGGLGE